MLKCESVSYGTACHGWQGSGAQGRVEVAGLEHDWQEGVAGKVPELNAELKLLGYSTTGKKAELILRLASAREEVGAILAHAGAHGMLFAPWPDPRVDTAGMANRASGLSFAPLPESRVDIAGSSSTDGVHGPGTLDEPIHLEGSSSYRTRTRSPRRLAEPEAPTETPLACTTQRPTSTPALFISALRDIRTQALGAGASMTVPCCSDSDSPCSDSVSPSHSSEPSPYMPPTSRQSRSSPPCSSQQLPAPGSPAYWPSGWSPQSSSARSWKRAVLASNQPEPAWRDTGVPLPLLDAAPNCAATAAAPRRMTAAVARLAGPESATDGRRRNIEANTDCCA